METIKKTINWLDIIYNKIPCSPEGKIINAIVLTILIIALSIWGWKIFLLTAVAIFALWIIFTIAWSSQDDDKDGLDYNEFVLSRIISFTIVGLIIWGISSLGVFNDLKTGGVITFAFVFIFLLFH